MTNLDPKWLLLAIVALVLGTIAAVVALICTGNQQYISAVTGITGSLVVTLLGAIGVSSHQANVQNQATIGERLGVADKIVDGKKPQDSK